jgi:hypothetical protein
MDRNKAMLDEIRNQGYVQVQNALMRMNDLDLALAMHYMHENDREFVLSFVGQMKADRVSLQLKRLKHVNVTVDQFDNASALFLSRLRGDRRVSSPRKYYRPGAAARKNRGGRT